MRRLPLILLVVAVLATLPGCVGILNGDSPTEAVSPTGTPDTTTPITHLTAEEVGSRAITAEEDRIETVLADRDDITVFSVGDFRPSVYSVIERNETGAIVVVRGVHSGTVECDNGETYTFDGAKTEARYLVTKDSVRLIRVNDPVWVASTPCS